MAATLEVGAEESLDEVEGGLGQDEAGGHDEHVGIIVLTGEGGDFAVPAEGCAHIGVLVGRHGNPVARAANQDSPCGGIFRHSLRQRMRKVGIVNTFC